MTPKMKEDICTQILGTSRQLFFSGRIAEVCQKRKAQKQLEFVLELMNEELILRDEKRRRRLIKHVGFPTYKTFVGYSFHQHSAGRNWNHWNLCPGRKPLCCMDLLMWARPHMAIAVGVKTCNLWYKTKFYTVTELVLKLAEAHKNGALEMLLWALRCLDLLILDEWGYVPVDKDESQLLFRVISHSYERKCLILTTNLEFFK